MARSRSRRWSAVRPARSAARLSQGMSGCRRMVPVDEQGASTSTPSNGPPFHSAARSEERRVGKECRSRWSPYDEKKKRKNRPCFKTERCWGYEGHATAKECYNI